MQHIDEIQKAISEFEKIQTKYAKFGATDTEPDSVFQQLLVRAFKGKKPTVPTDAQKWELYNKVGAPIAAKAMTIAARKVLDLIESHTDSLALQTELKNYCWRITW
jgi:hypothetical protein